MPLCFFVRTAITVVTPQVVYHRFHLPITHLIFFAVLLRNQGGITAEPRRCHCGHCYPIEARWQYHDEHWRQEYSVGGSTAGPVRYHCRTGDATAVRVRLRCGGRAAPRRRSAGLAVFRGTTAFSDGTTAEPRRP